MSAYSIKRIGIAALLICAGIFAFALRSHGAACVDGNPVISIGSSEECGSSGPAVPVTMGGLNARTISLATAYQGTDPTKITFVGIAVTCSATIALGSAQTNTIELRIGPTNAVSSGGGAQADVFGSSLSVSVIISIGWTGQQVLKAQLPIGYYFAVNRVAGTGCSVTSAFDQTVG